LYFEKYIQAYREHGIDIAMVMPQNEPNSDQNFPSCCWTPAGLARFISHLGPRMERQGVDVWFGTWERPKVALVDSVLTDPVAGKYIKGVGFQWAGRSALPVVREKYPELGLMMTEQECGNGRNDWSGVSHAWGLMKHYLSNGVSAYDYWNMSLLENGLSRWGWRQNSLVTVDPEQHTFRYTIEFYLLKHVSHYVQPGAQLLCLPAEADALAFRNPDGRVVLVVCNPEAKPLDLQVKLGSRTCALSMPPHSFNTLIL
jgi:glucosylceramidase